MIPGLDASGEIGEGVARREEKVTTALILATHPMTCARWLPN